MAKSGRFDTGEVELSYSEWPGESPPVVALHGLTARRASQFMENRGQQRAYAYDHRGHGESGRTPGAYSFVNYGRDAIAFLRGVVKEPAVVIGHSLGAMASIYVAAHAPELVRAAFLGEPPLYAPHTPLRDELPQFTAAREQAGKPVQTLIDAGLPPPAAEARNRLDPDTMTMILDGSAFAGWDTDGWLKRISCPVVLQHGDRPSQDRAGASALYPGELERAVPLLRNVQVLHIPGTGHLAWLSRPEEWNQALREFIAEHSVA